MTQTQAPDPNKDERLILAGLIEPADAERISSWVEALSWPQGVQLKDPESYHVTVVHCRTGGHDPEQRAWLDGIKGQFELEPMGLELFTNPGHLTSRPVVLKFAAPQLVRLAGRLYDEAVRRNLEPIRYDATYQPHITIAYAEEAPVPLNLPRPVTVKTLRLWD